MNDQIINLAHKDCLRTIHNIGGDIIRNICDGTSATVPWGSADWVAMSIVAVTLVMLAATLAVLAAAVYRLALQL